MNSDTVIYPVILSPDGTHILVKIPDLPGGFTQAESTLDAVKMAQDAIGNLLEDKTEYPAPSDGRAITLAPEEKLVYVTVDMTAFRRQYTKNGAPECDATPVPQRFRQTPKNQRLPIAERSSRGQVQPLKNAHNRGRLLFI